MFKAVLNTYDALTQGKVKGPVETALALSLMKDGADPEVLDNFKNARSDNP